MIERSFFLEEAFKWRRDNCQTTPEKLLDRSRHPIDYAVEILLSIDEVIKFSCRNQRLELDTPSL